MIKTKFLLFLSLPLLFILLAGLPFSVEASSAPQGIGQFETPTPGPDGRIIYTVRNGDSCVRIALLHSIDVNQLRALNPELDDDCIVAPGQQLMIGIGGPANAPTFTPGPSPTPTQVLPTPTPFGGTTEVCVLLFEDINGDGLRQETELGLAGGAISVTNVLGGYSKTEDTISQIDINTDEPAFICFGEKPPDVEEIAESEKLPEGKYTVSAAIPDGYNPTINLSYTLDVGAGERLSISFGAQSQATTLEDPIEEEGGNTSALLGIFGGFLLLGGAGLGWYAMRMNKSTTKMKY